MKPEMKKLIIANLPVANSARVIGASGRNVPSS